MMPPMAESATYRGRFQNAAKAQRYATRFERGGHRGIDRREQRAVAGVFAGLDDCASVLDVPSGAGRFLRTLAGAAGRRIIEIDVAHEMLGLARDRSRQHGVVAGVLQADALALPVRDGGVDCVFCNRLLHHILTPAERQQFLREFARVSRRYLVISFFDYHRLGALRVWLKRLQGRRPDYARQPTPGQFAEEARAAGFRVTATVPTGPFWVAEHYLLLEKV